MKCSRFGNGEFICLYYLLVTRIRELSEVIGIFTHQMKSSPQQKQKQKQNEEILQKKRKKLNSRNVGEAEVNGIRNANAISQSIKLVLSMMMAMTMMMAMQ